MVDFVAIVQGSSRTENLFHHDLSFKKARVANLVQLIRLCAVIEGMRRLLNRRDTPEFESFEWYVPSSHLSISGTR